MDEAKKNNYQKILTGIESKEIRSVSTDSRTIGAGDLFIALKGDRFDGHAFVADVMRKGAWGAVVDRSALEKRHAEFGSGNILPVEDTLAALQELSRLHRNKFMLTMIGITGSNGKTTTKEMLAGIMKQRGPVLKNEGNLNNHIGVPLTLMKLTQGHVSGVVEMGMSGRGEIALLSRLASPDIGVITNIGPAHLEFLGSLDGVAEAKAELLGNIKAGGTAVLNRDSPFFAKLSSKWSGTILSFGIDHQADVAAFDITQDKDTTAFTLSVSGDKTSVRLRPMGKHNVYNALAAAAGATAAGMSLDAVRRGLDDFQPVSMRSELKEIEGRTVLADYYNANPGSVAAALETLVSLGRNGRTLAVLGDMLELGPTTDEEHRAIGRTAASLGVSALVTIGALANNIIRGAREAGMPGERLFSAGTHAEAAALIKKLSGNGDAVLIKGSRGMKMEKILEEF